MVETIRANPVGDRRQDEQDMLAAIVADAHRHVRLEEDDMLRSDPRWKAARDHLDLAERFAHKAEGRLLVATAAQDAGPLRFDNEHDARAPAVLRIGDLRGTVENDATFEDDATLVIEIDGRYSGHAGKRARVVVTIGAPRAPTTGPSADQLQFDLECAYRISEDATDHDVRTLFWAMDRFSYDRSSSACGQDQRFQARQRIAVELDRRKVPMRNPALPSSYPAAR